MSPDDTSISGQVHLFQPPAASLACRHDLAGMVETVWAYYVGWSHQGACLDTKRRRLIQARLEDGYSAEQLCTAIRGCHTDAWYMGENDRGKRYCDIALILRDADHVDRFIMLAEHPRQPSTLSGRDMARAAGTADGYLGAFAAVTRAER